MKMLKKLSLLFAASLMIFLGSCQDDDDAPVVREQMVSVGDYRLNTLQDGTGNATVILLSGMNGGIADWKTIFPELAEENKVLAYGRSGLSGSEWCGGQRDAITIAKELHALLQAKKLSPPYILMAHSLGGMYARVYADQYPKEVSGMVLVDPTPETLEDEILALIPDTLRAEVEAGLEAAYQDMLSSLPDKGAQEEMRDIALTKTQVIAAGIADVPLAVISSLKSETDNDEFAKEMSAAIREGWVKSVSEGKHFTTLSAGHFVQRDDPALVMEALKWVKAIID
jgi:pimeloyl-ACP methyl ester carboxylesterase